MSADEVEGALEIIKDLYDYRNKYFLTHDTKDGSQKDEDVKSKLKETLDQLDTLKDVIERKDRALFCMLKGKALNVEANFNADALELLSKAVKLNPKLSEAWNQLGECYWKNGDLKAAMNCFEGSLKHEKKEKVSLRSLSMLLRQMGENPEEKTSNLLRSLELAKEAVAVDVNDGMSWYNLGNAYFSLCFVSLSHNSVALKQCKAAYSKAILDETAALQPDFLFNYAVVLQYEQEFQTALSYFRKASRLDPSWPDPEERHASLCKFLLEMDNMIAKKGSLKPKRIQNMIETLRRDLHLGAYFNKLNPVKVKEMSIGENKDYVFLGKLIGFITSDNQVCPFFCMVDENRDCVAVCVYNLNPAKGPKLGDSIAIPEPLFSQINVKHENISVTYCSIVVNKPNQLLINGKQLSEDCIVRPHCTFTIKSD